MQLAPRPLCIQRLGAAPCCAHVSHIQITAPRRRLHQQRILCKAKGDDVVTARADNSNASAATLWAALGLLSPLFDVQAANAHDVLTEGRTVSLVHPFFMFFLFGSTLWTGWLGLQWRRLRTLPSIVKELKAQLPAANEEGQREPSPLDNEIKALEAERKALSAKDLKGTHHNWGGLLVGLGVSMAIIGPLNTYIRLGKLFPGPHLYAGAGIVVLWALASAMVPLMAKGSDVARTLHITFNCMNLALFAWQIPTGLEIVGKVLANAPAP